MFLAQDVRHRRPVAIKVMQFGDFGMASGERFRREIELEAKLQHPHIVPLFDSGDLPGGSYFVMPFIAGESLEQRLAREGSLSVTDALTITRQVADALAYAHERRVVHRDIKPANILLADGNALVADFGVARAVDTGTNPVSVTRSGIQIGTPAYMSPEQAAADPSLDGRSDIYSLGCVLYEMLAGRPPFHGSRPGSVLARHALDPVPPMRTVRPSVPENLELIVMKMLEKSPEDRFSTARELCEALTDASLETRVRPTAARPAQRLKRMLLVSAVVAPVAGWFAWTAADSHLLRGGVTVDTSRVVVFPLEGADESTSQADDQLRRALHRWRDVDFVDPYAVREALGSAPLSVRRATRISRDLGAGRFIRGSISGAASGAEVRVALYDAAGGSIMLAERMVRLPAAGPARDSLYQSLAGLLLFRHPPQTGIAVPSGTRVLEAAEHYLQGREAVTRWALDSASVAFSKAWQLDNGFGEAALWLALSRFWLNEQTSTWRIAAQAAARDTLSLSSREVAAAGALLAQSDGSIAVACDTWRSLTQRAPFDFWSWYSSALCLDSDKIVVRDNSSPSGWRFRSSYHTALLHYLRAFELMPTIHRALHDNSFERVRSLLFVSANVMRAGSESGGSGYFFASPLLQADTLVFIPYSADQIGSATLGAALPQLEAVSRTTRRQRQLFRSIATSWVASDPASADAREALALALQLLGDPASIDTLASAARLAATRDERLRLAGTEAWIRLRFALPDNHASLRLVRTLSDSVLRLDTDEADQHSDISLAALTGKVSSLLALSTGARNSLAFNIPADVSELAHVLQILAAFGVTGDTIVRLGQRLEQRIAGAHPVESRNQLRQTTLSRAATLAWPGVRLPFTPGAHGEGDYLMNAVAADIRGDEASVRASISALRELRRQVPPSAVSFDALLTEATLLSRHGASREAAEWLDEAMAALRTATPDFDPINAAALVRAMALRAEIARELGDRDTAHLWAGAVVELWADADPLLQPLVERMRSLMM